MKPVFGVVFREGTTIKLSLFGAQLIDFPSGPQWMMNCTEVRETAFGLLQLVPKAEGGTQLPTLFVPPHEIAWMLRADDVSTLGFLPAAQ